MSNEKNTRAAGKTRFWRTWWPVAAFILLTTGVVAWIFYPACSDIRAQRAHLAGMGGFFAWYIPWLIVSIRNAWRDMKPRKVNPALMAALNNALGLPDESDEPEWHESPEFNTDNSVFAYEREYENELRETLDELNIDFEIEKP